VQSGVERYLLDQPSTGDACRLWAYPLCGIHVTPVLEIRTATSQDAEAALTYFSTLQAENLTTIFQVDSLPTLDEEATFLRGFETDENSSWFAAISEDAIVGNLGLKADPRSQRHHAAILGMSVLAPFRSAGLGTRLLQTALSWAESSALRRVELDVLESNSGAIRLYERFGFSIYGRKPEAVLVDGIYVDMIEMSRSVP
jgi:RimJ/RimL family protein N-acetyltransferase